MRPAVEGIRLPAFPPLRWFGVETPRPRDLRDRAVLVEFWDPACVHSIRALPYLSGWDERYREAGLFLAAVLSPELPFGRDPAWVRGVLAELGVRFPVAHDPELRAWHAFHAPCWPTRYLFDGAGTLRYYHFGEGDYAACERVVQECLAERDAGFERLPTLDPVRPADRPGSLYLAGTTRLDLGTERTGIGNPEALRLGETVRFEHPGRREPDRAYAEGPWHVELRRIETVGSEPAWLHLRLRAAEVHWIAECLGPDPVEVTLSLDEGPIPGPFRGRHVFETATGETRVRVGAARLHELVGAGSLEPRELRLRAEAPGLCAYAFDFVHPAAEPASEPR